MSTEKWQAGRLDRMEPSAEVTPWSVLSEECGNLLTGTLIVGGHYGKEPL